MSDSANNGGVNGVVYVGGTPAAGDPQAAGPAPGQGQQGQESQGRLTPAGAVSNLALATMYGLLRGEVSVRVARAASQIGNTALRGIVIEQEYHTQPRRIATLDEVLRECGRERPGGETV